MTYDLGDAVALTATARDASGDPANATGAALTVTLPDGTTASPEVTNPPAETGVYTVSYPTTQAGLHAVRWVFTDPASAHTDVFNVRAAVPRMIFSLAEAKAKLRKTSTADDEELRGVIAATTSKVEDVVGPIVRTTHRERHVLSGAADAIALHHRHVLEVTEVASDFTATVVIDPADLDIDGEAGIIRPKAGAFGHAGGVWVTYVVGRLVVDEAILEAAEIILDHLWETRRGHSGVRPGMFGAHQTREADDAAGVYFSGFALPARAAELLEPFSVPDGLA